MMPEFQQPIPGEKVAMMDQDFQINPMILEAVMSIKKIPISVPKIVTKECAIVLTDSKGAIRMNDNNEPLYEMKEVNIFEGWEHTTVDLPIPEFSTSALISSNLNEDEISLIRSIFTDVAFLVVRMVKENKDYSEYISQLYIIIAGIADPSKARGGRLMELMKTRITKGETRMEQIQKQLIDEEEHRGLWDKIMKR